MSKLDEAIRATAGWIDTYGHGEPFVDEVERAIRELLAGPVADWVDGRGEEHARNGVIYTKQGDRLQGLVLEERASELLAVADELRALSPEAGR